MAAIVDGVGGTRGEGEGEVWRGRTELEVVVVKGIGSERRVDAVARGEGTAGGWEVPTTTDGALELTNEGERESSGGPKGHG